MGGDGLIPVGAAVETPYAAAKTSVWWDIENCQLPRGCDAHAIAQNINAALMKMSYHGPVTISAYGDTNGIPSSILRVLFSTGIGFNHVPDGVNDTSDKKILVDMLFWAVDNPAPAYYLLISGDKDFSNAIHQLWMGKYNILLAQPFKASPALSAAAPNLWEWTSVVAGGSPLELAFGTNKSCQESIPTPIFEPISANQPAYSNAHTNAHASRGQSLSNPVSYFDTKAKAIYVSKNSSQLTMLGMSSMPARIEEASSSYCPRAQVHLAPAVAPVEFAPHCLIAKSDSSEKHNSRIEETSSSYPPHAPAVAPVQFAPHCLLSKSDSSENNNSRIEENSSS